MTARPLFVGGTSSNAGKSWMTTAICAWLRAKGMAVAPFKAQNMSNHSYPCRGGGEIGRAQVAQAEACGLEPEPAMNPILLKPTGDGRSQVIVNGRVWKTLSARDYYAHSRELRATVLEAYAKLAARFDAIVIEGAGSVTEVNLRDHDLANLGLATALGAPWLLVADIERGGVFASIVGTMQLLSDDERALYRGFAINKFRGDASLFDDGVRILEANTGSPCFGVFPYAPDIHLDAEDSLAVATQPHEAAPRGARTAIVRFPCLSNATDFRLLRWADWIATPPPRDYDVVVLPGSKNTIADLKWMREVELAQWVSAQHRRGARIVGICGGYQMMGRTIADPDGVESAEKRVEGLGLLPVVTTLAPSKVTRAVTGRSAATGVEFGGYEIHMGVTSVEPGEAVTPFAVLEDGTFDGIRRDDAIGTYLHGALEHPAMCAEIFGIDAPVSAAKADEYTRLGAWFQEHGRHLDRLFDDLS